MNQIDLLKIRANAKINLTLDITGKRPDGYHTLSTVMQSVSLHDHVTAARGRCSAGDIRIACDDPRIPCDCRNLAHQAACAFFHASGVQNPGIFIDIEKRIPSQAGLGGGSADAAGTLVALDRLMDTRMTAAELCAVAETVGADVPFCVLGAAAYAEGPGTILTPLPSLPDCAVVIAKPLDGVSTAEAYRLVDRAALTRRPHTGAAVDAVCAGDLAAVAHGLCNVFEEALALPEVAAIGQVMREHGTLGCRMTGSGSAVFGLFDNEEAARRCAAALRRDYDEVFQCRPCPHGPL